MKRLPKGMRMDPLSCPCGKLTGLIVGYWTYNDLDKNEYTLPYSVTRFASVFDDGKLPQYDAALVKERSHVAKTPAVGG